jgi:hypothetical protein
VLTKTPHTNGMMTFKAADDELQIVWGEVYVGDVLDSQGEFMTIDTVRKSAYEFMIAGRTLSIDVQHDNKSYKAYLVETFISRKGDPIYIPDAWVVGVYVEDRVLWQAIKDGDLNGFSLVS